MQEVLSRGSQVRGGVGGSNTGCLSGSALGSARVGLEEVGRGRGTVTPGAGMAPQRCSQWGGRGTRPFDIPGGMWMAQQGGDSRELAPFRDEPRSS